MDSIQKKADGQSVFQDVSALLRDMQSNITEPVRVREEELANQLGVSRTPVREALIRLEGMGMIHLRPGRGALLTPVSDEEYIEWLQLREQLESFATREAALNASQRDVERLRDLFTAFIGLKEEGFPSVAYGQANVAFHKEIIALARNRLLERVWEAFGHRQTSYRRQTIKRLHRFTTSLSEHLAIIDAIECRDADLAEKLARQHVRTLYDAFIKSSRSADSV